MWKLNGITQLSERRSTSTETKPSMRRIWLNNGGNGMLNTGASDVKICTNDTRMRTLTVTDVTRHPRRDIAIDFHLFHLRPFDSVLPSAGLGLLQSSMSTSIDGGGDGGGEAAV